MGNETIQRSHSNYAKANKAPANATRYPNRRQRRPTDFAPPMLPGTPA
jgi:hypothetical protein